MRALRRFAPALVFLTALPLLWLRFGHWFFLSLDEGIYLDGSRRVAAGQVLYRDLFNITGPGTFWLYGLVFRLFGASLPAARAVLCLELALVCALVCWLVRRSAGTAVGAASALLFLAMLLTTLYPVYITHRWDSNVIAFGALCAATRRWLFLAGALAALAAWITPPLVWIVLAVGLLAARNGLRGYLAGVAVPTFAAVAVLGYQGALGDMAHSLLWDTANYSAANRLPYGALTGTFESFRRQGTLAAAVVHYTDSLLPALLPPLAAVAFAVTRRPLVLLSGTAFAALVACFPRPGAAQLLFAVPFFWAVCWCAAGLLLPRRARHWLAACALLLAVGAVAVAWPRNVLKTFETPAGVLAVSRLHFVTLNDLISTVHPGERVFVYPYLPALYFILGVDNPTRYSWLQPGMMGPRDEMAAIADLTLRPPRHVIWHDFTDAYILKNWPASDRGRLHFPAMEMYLNSNYHVVNPDGVVPTGYRLLERN